ncbi:YdcF family protein [Fictibacillus iocasae]|uniref:YdcF family protein n=1 Tax=Fictibacillus iocasae TaxID=2715437 RepID=A0ABW2NLH0_9BACL
MRKWLWIVGAGSVIYALAMVAQTTNMDAGLAFFLVLGMLLLTAAKWFEQSVGWYRKHRLAFWAAGVCAFAAVIVLESFILTSAVTDPKKVDSRAETILILGAGTKDGRPGAVLKARLDKALEFDSLHNKGLFVVSGGKGLGKKVSEGQVMKNYLMDNGVEEERIIIEDKATSTHENIAYATQLIEKRSRSGKLLIVTSDFHLFRAKYIAKKQGIKAEGLGAPLRISSIPQAHVREYFAIIKTLISS